MADSPTTRAPITNRRQSARRFRRARGTLFLLGKSAYERDDDDWLPGHPHESRRDGGHVRSSMHNRGIGADHDHIGTERREDVHDKSSNGATDQPNTVIAWKRPKMFEFVARDQFGLPQIIRYSTGRRDRSRRRPRVNQFHRVTRTSVIDSPSRGRTGCRGAVHSHDDSFSISFRFHSNDSGFKRLSDAEFVMTERLDSAIAAAAIIGFRRPIAAIGTAAALYANAQNRFW